MTDIDNKIKKELAENGISLSIRKRKLAGGEKKYFVVTPMPLSFTKPFYVVAREVIAKYYPVCGITSCGMSSATIAEY